MVAFYKVPLLSIGLWIFLGILIYNSLYSYVSLNERYIVTGAEAFKYDANMQNNEENRKEIKKKTKKKNKKKGSGKINHHDLYIQKLKEENNNILDKLHMDSSLEEDHTKYTSKKTTQNTQEAQYEGTKLDSESKDKEIRNLDDQKKNAQNQTLLSMLEEEENDSEDNVGEITESDENKVKKKKCTDRGNGCLEDVVSPFVTLMKNINELNTNDNKKRIKKQEQNVYNDEKHTITVFDEDHEDKDLYKKYKKTKKNGMKTKVIEGSEYLGAGYDFIFGNPIGDPLLNVDPGYRDSIVKLTYPKSDADYPDNYININPNGSFIRNEISCTRSEKDTEISSMSSYTKELSVDASVSVSAFLFASFSASVGYQSTSSTISKNKDKMFMLKSYCFKYVASLSQYSQWKLTDQFKRAINVLPSYFNSLEEEGKFCHAADYKDKDTRDECGPSVEAWMNFFKNFGTHVSTIIHLGGKITQTLKISKSEFKSMEEEGVSVSISASAKYGPVSGSASTNTDTSTSSENQSKKSSMEKDTVIIGGITIFDPNNPDDFEKWAGSIKNNAMPIKGEYEPLSRILPVRLMKVYDEALEFYVYLSSPKNVEVITNDDATSLDIREYLKNADLVYASGSGLQMIECGQNKNFALGFSISLPEKLSDMDDFSANTCDVDQDKCFSKMRNNQVYSYLFALCSSEYFPFLEQKIKSEKGQFLSLECSQKDQVIFFGFGLSILDSEKPVEVVMHPCAYGKRTCSIQGITQKSQAALWIVCGHVDTLNSKFTSTVNRVQTQHLHKKKKKRKPLNACNNDALFNFLFEFSNTPFNKRSGQCFRATRGCWSSFADTCFQYKSDQDFNFYMFTLY